MSSQVKTINILGVTGSIGRSAADIILSDPDRFQVQVVTAHNNAILLSELAIRLGARKAVLVGEKNFSVLQSLLQNTSIECVCGPEALEEAAAEKADITLAAMVGMAGLSPIMQAIRNSKAVAIANKEPLVAAGPLVMSTASLHGTQIIPVDSEHNAIFQVFDEKNKSSIEKIILTASGGPFLKWTTEQMEKATPAQALAHPNWSMGRKISIDSATMMNKALEVIEASYLFDMPLEKIDVVVHPQSVIHSMVEYADGSILAQMGASDMRTPIAHALAWPDRMKTPGQKLDIKILNRLDFEKPDFARFPALAKAYEALKNGPFACVALNAANEVAVDAFLTNRIGFLDIMRCIEHILGGAPSARLDSLGDIQEYDRKIREQAQAWIQSGATQKMVSVL